MERDDAEFGGSDLRTRILLLRFRVLNFGKRSVYCAVYQVGNYWASKRQKVPTGRKRMLRDFWAVVQCRSRNFEAVPLMGLFYWGGKGGFYLFTFIAGF